jgi:hypothetical protein
LGKQSLVGRTITCLQNHHLLGEPSLVGESHHFLEKPITGRQTQSLVGENHQLLKKTMTCWKNNHFLGKSSVVEETITF